jgi:hypothetical protein
MRTFNWIGPASRGLGGIVKSYLTAPDGQSYAPGRLMGAVTFVIAQGLVVKASAAMLPVLKTAQDWQTFFIGVAGFQMATGGTCIALVLGIAPADSGGKWWAKEACPPPPPGRL